MEMSTLSFEQDQEVLQAGDVAGFHGTEEFPMAVGTILSVKAAQSGGVNEYVVQVAPKVLGVYQAAQLICLCKARQHEEPEQVPLTL